MDDDRFRLLIENLPGLIWMSGADKSCIYFNRQWLVFTGRALEQELLDGWTSGIHPDDRNYCVDTYTSYYYTQEVFTIEFRLRRFDGEYRWMSCTAAPWYSLDGAFGGYTGSVTDITDRKNAEEEQRQLQQQLQQMQKMEAVGRLTGGVAHDFNNILGSVIGYTSLALARYVPDKNGKLAEYLHEVHQAGERARDLVAQMLAFSRGATGEHKPHQLAPFVKEAVKLLQATLPADIDIHTQIGRNIPAVVTDPVQLHQIIINLCINAQVAMANQGSINIRLRRVAGIDKECASCHEQAQGDFVELAVIDTGRGIDPGVMVRMFDPFYSTSEPGQSSGMGLSVVHGMVHDHGGHIEVESTPGKGSTFKLLFPVIDATSKRMLDGQIGKSAWAEDKANGYHILIVDDDKALAEFIKERLKSQGYQVSIKPNSSAVLKVFCDDPAAFDLVVLDQTIPGMTGMELAQALLGVCPKLPIILCAGYSDEVNEELVKALGIQGYLGKPFGSGALLAKVEALLQDDGPQS